MHVALVADPSAATPAGSLARALLERLPAAGELELFGGGGAPPWTAIRPRAVERIVHVVGNEASLAFAVPAVRRLGGIVVLLDWDLTALARSARPALERGGLFGRVAAWREGGWAAARGLASGTLNRSIVRFGDAFVVADDAMRRRVLDERNAHTPILTAPLDDPGAAAEELAARLEAMPAHRSARRSLISTAIEHADKRRAERET